MKQAKVMLRQVVITVLVMLAVSNHLLGQEGQRRGADSLNVGQDSLPYLKYPTLPAFNILSVDSVTLFNTYNIPKGRPCVLLFFDPDCKHCKATTKLLLSKMDSLQDIDFYFLSARHDMGMIREFYQKFKLNAYSNIKVVGMDTEFFFFSFFKVKFVPDLALYDARGNLIKLLDGSCTVKDIYDLTHGH